MLVITRKIGEVVWIGKDIRIEVSKIGDNKVKLAIAAPKEVNIVREELMKKEKARVIDKIFLTSVSMTSQGLAIEGQLEEDCEDDKRNEK